MRVTGQHPMNAEIIALEEKIGATLYEENDTENK